MSCFYDEMHDSYGIWFQCPVLIRFKIIIGSWTRKFHVIYRFEGIQIVRKFATDPYFTDHRVS